MALGESPPLDLLLPAQAEAQRSQPGLARLLQDLGTRLGGDGLSPRLRSQLRQAQAALGVARRAWLQQELLWRLLTELIRDPQDCDPRVLHSLEQELTLAQLRRGAPEIARLVPPAQPSRLLPLLLPELERRLSLKQRQLRHFLLGPQKNPNSLPEIPQNPQIPKIPPKIGENPTENRQNLGENRQNLGENHKNLGENREISHEIPPEIAEIRSKIWPEKAKNPKISEISQIPSKFSEIPSEIPGISSKIPENRKVLHEICSEIHPEKSKNPKIPQISSKIPEMSSRVSKIPKIPSEISEIPSEIPEIPSGISKFPSQIPPKIPDVRPKVRPQKPKIPKIPKISEASLKISKIPTENSEIPEKNSEIRPKNCEIRPKSSEIHPKNYEIRPKNSEILPKNSEIRPKNSEIPQIPKPLPKITELFSKIPEIPAEIAEILTKIPEIPPEIPSASLPKNFEIPAEIPEIPSEIPEFFFGISGIPPGRDSGIWGILGIAEIEGICPKTTPGELRLRLRRERIRERILGEKVWRMDWEYPQVLRRCHALLTHLGQLQALQAHLDQRRGRYLAAKGVATLLKARLEELRILLDTYPSPTIAAHRRIREELSRGRGQAQAAAAILGAELAQLRGLGPELRALALELGRILDQSEQRSWALRQLRPPH